MFGLEAPALALQATASLFFLQVVIATSTIDTDHIFGCHNNNVMLNCPLYQTAKSESDTVELEWRYKDKQWKQLATIDGDGNRSLYSNMTRYQDRLTLHPNGSMMLASLKPDDERMYLCRVRVDGSTKQYLIKLNVTCTGKVTVVRREVCVEEDIVLDCDAKHRTNPRKLKRVTWHVKNSSNSDISWSPVVDSDRMTVKGGGDYKMNENGSLSLHSRVRDESEVTYRCEASKIVDSTREIHVVVLKSIKCAVLRKEPSAEGPSTVKVCAGNQIQLVCPFLNPANTSHVRSVKWRVRREGSSKHPQQLQQLFHVKLIKTSNGTIFGQNLVPNASRLNEGVELAPNGSLLIKRVRSVHEGDYECVVKTRHHHEPKKHLIRLKPISCKANGTLAPSPSRTRPGNIKTTSGRIAMTTAPTKKLNDSNQNSGAASMSVAQSNKTRNGSQTTSSLARFLAGSRKQSTIKSSTSTSTWTMMKPSLQTIKTSTRVTTFTTFSSGEHEGGESLLKEWQWAGDKTNKDDFVNCGGVLNGTTGTFQSPNFPSAYPANSHCKWTISLPQGYAAINVTFHHFDLEDEDDCRRDHVAIFDELGNQVGPRYCGIMNSPSNFQVKGSSAAIVFHSDASLQKTGFKLTYQSDRRAE